MRKLAPAVTATLLLAVLTGAAQARPGNAVDVVAGATRTKPEGQRERPGVVRTGNGWERLPGSAIDIGAAAKTSRPWDRCDNPQHWVVGTNRIHGGFGIYYWWDGDWLRNREGEIARPFRVPGAVSIALGDAGSPWIINDANQILRRAGCDMGQGQWYRYPWGFQGQAKDIASPAEDKAWVVGGVAHGGFGIYWWKAGSEPRGGHFEPIDGGAVRIATEHQQDGRVQVEPGRFYGRPWVVNEEGHIYRRTDTGWERMPGSASDIGIGGHSAVWVIGTYRVPGGFAIYTWREDRGIWEQIDGGGVRIAVDSTGLPWVVNEWGHIYRRT